MDQAVRRVDKRTVSEKIGVADMKKKGIIFDLDGVIVSTDRLHYQAWKKIADKLGIAFDEKKNNRLREQNMLLLGCEIGYRDFDSASL